MSGTGLGRGGRGAALLAALNEPVRRPGASLETEASQQSTPAHSHAGTPTRTGAPVVKPTGRGRGMALLQALNQQSAAQQRQQEVVPSTTPATQSSQAAAAPILGGRGAAMVSAQKHVAAAAPPSLGRARALQDLLKQPSTTGGGRGALMAAALPPASSVAASPARPASKTRTPLQPSPASSSHEPGLAGEGEGGDRRLTKLEYMLQRMSCEEAPVCKPGNSGERIPLVANYIPVRCSKEGQYQYSVHFHPDIHSKNMRFKLLYAQGEVIGDTRNFDGAILFLPIRLPQEETVVEAVRPTDQEKIQIKIKLVKVLPPEQCIQLYNVLFRNIMKILKYVQVNRHDYDPHRPAKIPQHRLEVWPGYVTALSRYEGGLMLMTDVSHKVLRTQTAYEMIEDIHAKSGSKGFRDEVTRELVGSVVMTRYNNKTYRIDDVDWSMSPNSSFDLANGEKCTFMEYYVKHYNKEIRDPKQPLLVHRPKLRDQEPGKRPQLEIILLVPELCYLTGLSDQMRADFKVMKDLAIHTRVSPAQRQLAMRNYCENVNSHPEARKELEKWGLELDMDCINLPGRKIAEERIFFKNKHEAAGPRADWGRAATSRDAMLGCVDLRNWMVVCTQRNANITADAINMLIRCAKEMGMAMTDPKLFKLSTDRTEDYIRTIREHCSEQVQMVMMIMPTSRDDRYNSVKKLLCCERPVPSQVINARTITRKDKLRSVCQKVVLQLNCKLGGTLWRVAIPKEINSPQAGGLMVVGIDVYHDKSHGQSCAAIVCSTDTQITRYYSEVLFQSNREEIISKMRVCFMNGIRQYHSENNMLPMNIIVFRDGVGDGQMRVVAEHEVPQFLNTFQSFGPDYKPKFAEVVVQKRINTRMFLRRGHGRNATLENPAPGSILDHTVTRRDVYDFFLVSQHVTQGTVTPTHYVVVKDWAGWEADLMQKITYQMCHMYYNWPGTVRVPAPCQYAHKLAQLAGMNLHKAPHKQLNNRLFYL